MRDDAPKSGSGPNEYDSLFEHRWGHHPHRGPTERDNRLECSRHKIGKLNFTLVNKKIILINFTPILGGKFQCVHPAYGAGSSVLFNRGLHPIQVDV